MKLILVLLASILIASTAPTVHAHRRCYDREDPSGANVIAATAKKAQHLVPAFEAFRGLLGGENNGNALESKSDGHRQISWDADAIPFDMPGDFFANKYGCVITTSDLDGNEFRVSNPPNSSGVQDDRFDSIIPSSQAQEFVAFTEEKRLFSPLHDNEIYVNFVDPGDTSKFAKVTGFGAVFIDVDSRRSSKMEFLDVDGCKLLEVQVPPAASGLSFLGAHLGNDATIATVKITIGEIAIGHDDLAQSNHSATNVKSRDLVVMDDFLYGEPQQL